MKVITSIFFYLLVQVVLGQSLVGAWEWTEVSAEGQEIRAVVSFSEKYQSVTRFSAKDGAFIDTNGGLWSIDGKRVTERVEFNSADSSRVGTSISFDIEWDGDDKVRIVGQEVWMNRIDSGEPGNLQGAWLMSGRKRDGEIQERDTTRSRKTMKILSGTRFQWIAYDTQTKQFKGTGGGTYTTVDGKYTENIEFFSRDNNRVGASLEFNYELVDGKWHHSGKSSKGKPLYEVWSKRR
ncbi:MAG: membrane or secreted protein [Ekhidna sp.]|nr:membrane or secreted protein [Ekhidna sp.]